ncbi:MAG: PAS domain S-box protein [Bacteroidetes bacterium]|nr:PAS domain S-box protein [Bacteroidota bacterium]
MADPLKILILEDSDTDAEIVQRLLKKTMPDALYHVTMDKESYVKELKSFRPDVILSDNSMPQFNAAEALRIVREQSLTPFIMVTGAVSEEFAAAIIKSGADDYVLKDRLAKLPMAIEAALKQRQSEREKQEALQKLAESEEKYRTQIERVSDAFIAFDKNFRYTYMNKKAGEMTHRDPQSLIGKYVWDEFPEAIGSATWHAFNKAMETQQYISNTDYYEPLQLWQENHLYPSPDGLSVFIRDISEKVKAEKKLVENERRFRAMIENNADAIMLTDRNLTAIYQSPSAERLSGITITERQAKPGINYTHPDDVPLVRAAIDTSLRRPGQPIPFQSRMKHADGHYLWIEGVVTNLLSDTSIQAMAFNYRDVTERKKAEQKLNSSLEEIRELASHLQDVREEERASMAREIHDELGQQLTGLKMDITWLYKRSREDDMVQQKLKGTLDLLDTMVKTVRKIATDLRPSILDDLGLLEAIEWQSKEFEKRSGIPVRFSSSVSDINPPSNITTALFRIYQESLTNVARHSGATQVETRLDIRDNLLILSITDNGKGFDTGQSGQKKTLGLLGMKERSLMVGGTYDIASKPGSGTTVLVSVPYRQEALAASDA